MFFFSLSFVSLFLYYFISLLFSLPPSLPLSLSHPHIANSDDGILQLLTPPNVTLTLGTPALISFKASFDTNGSPSDSARTYSDLRIDYPISFNAGRTLLLVSGGARAATLYEISPYNYVIYFPAVLSGIAGTTTITNSKYYWITVVLGNFHEITL